jgi:hypothetical protein
MHLRPLSQHQPQSVLSKLEEEVSRAKSRIGNLQGDNQELKHKLKKEQKENTELKEKIKELEKELAEMRGSRAKLAALIWKPKKGAGEQNPLGKKLGGTGFFRPDPLPERLTTTYTFSLESCPDCAGAVGPANQTRTAFTEDIVLAAPRIEKYEVTRHWCSSCQKQVRSPEAPDLSQIRRIGLRTLGYILYARYCLDTPLQKIALSLLDLYGLKLSEGEVVNQLREARDLFGPDYQSICELLTSASVVHADETGFRVMGENWWLWVGVTPEGITKFQVHHSRGKGAAHSLLGTNPGQVRVTDFYNAYYHLPGPHQVCWVHLIRDAKETHGQLSADLSEVYHRLKEELKKPVKARDPGRFKKKLTEIAGTDYGKEKPVITLQNRIRDFNERLLTCLYYDQVEPENNKAERALRPQVIKRKIFGSIRSLDGAITHETNSSVLTTYLNQTTQSFFDVILPILNSRLA